MPKKISKKQKSEKKSPTAVLDKKVALGKVKLNKPEPTSSDRKGPSLVVVESPAKERTIARFLKSGYVVKSSYGHVRDLPVRKMGVSVEDDFEPQYVVLPRAKKIIAEFKSLVQKSPFVYLATDPDREGESIAWHLSEVLGLKPERIRRIAFHEITPGAVNEALASPRQIDENLVHAQQARRVIDRLVGYTLSPLLWEKIQSGLSAGRVQSVAVRLLAERDKEIKDFTSETFWTLAAVLEKSGADPSFAAKLNLWQGKKIEIQKTFQLFAEEYRVRTTTLDSVASVEAIEKLVEPGPWRVTSVDRKEARRRPSPPFSTSTLQQAASQKLGFAADRTMRIAQSLYEGVEIGGGEPVGLITYMRTDSFSVSTVAAEETAQFLREKFGDRYVPAQRPIYQTKSKGAQEAHEAIRPTGVRRTPESVRKFLNPEQAKLYDLIWKRFVASQMIEAIYDTVSVDIEGPQSVFHTAGRTLKFDGFLKIYSTAGRPKDDEEEESGEPEESAKTLPDLKAGDVLKFLRFEREEHHSSSPPHYNEASLIKAMEKHGIGRPSTYAPTIKTIVDRGYVRRNPKDRRLSPSDLGILVTEQLKGHFPDVVSLTYTAEVEEKLDAIAEGREKWVKVVHDFFSPFKKSMEMASRQMPVVKQEPKMSDEKCPVCNSPMLIRESRFGKYLSCSTFPKCKGKISLDADGKKAVLEVTGEMCDVCGKPMVIRTGRKGRFMACSGYPACKNTFSLDADGKKIESSRPIPVSRKCPKCGSNLLMREGKRGHFVTCPGFPKCRYLSPISREDAQKYKDEANALKEEKERKEQKEKESL